MTFTEAAFEVADSRHPFCRLTRHPHGAHAVYRILDTGELARRQRAHVAFHGPPELADELVRELRAAQPLANVDVLYQDAEQTSLAVETPIDPAGDAPGLASIAASLQQRGLPALLDPIVASEGRIRIRILIPRHVDAPDVLRALQHVQRACGFSDFRVQRIGTVLPAAHVESARRALPAEQEALLALAASMGYYETPKGVTLEEISRAVGLSISPVHKRLKAAEETLVAQHVAEPAPGALRRRTRNTPPRIEPTSPWEVQLRVQGDPGIGAQLAQAPGTRASLHALSSDGKAQASILVAIAPQDTQTRLLAALEARPEVASVQVIERSPHHVATRLATRERGAFSLSWWTDAWGADAAVRSIVCDGEETYVRALLARPHTPERLRQRLEACAQGAGWKEWEVVRLRCLANGGPPPLWPEPLTQRQLEVLRVAHALGYYRTPRGCTLEHVANTLGVSANAIHKNLVLAESKLIAAYLAAGL